MKLKSIKRDLFLIPPFNGNLEEPKEEQVKVIYSSLPTASEVRTAIMGGGTIEHDFCARYVKKIENLELDGEKLDTYEKIMNSDQSGLVELLRDIARDLISVEVFTEGED